MRFRLISLAVLALALLPPVARGNATGGTAPEPSAFPTPPATTGGSAYGVPVPPASKPKPKAKPKRRTVRRKPKPKPKPRRTVVERPRFPVVGFHSFTDGFGVPRSGGRKHTGQDVAAPEGTPLLAVWKGRVIEAGYGTGAGYYVVIHGTGTNRDYVYYHLRKDSTRVRTGQSVRTGQRIGDVGNTGNSFGAHLHFEIWEGPWFAGGHAIDPLPDLLRWDAYS
jgi:murein DD-endopeptidase MepM/ murein hydrolase activator NlpD